MIAPPGHRSRILVRSIYGVLLGRAVNVKLCLSLEKNDSSPAIFFDGGRLGDWGDQYRLRADGVAALGAGVSNGLVFFCVRWVGLGVFSSFFAKFFSYGISSPRKMQLDELPALERDATRIRREVCGLRRHGRCRSCCIFFLSSLRPLHMAEFSPVMSSSLRPFKRKRALSKVVFFPQSGFSPTRNADHTVLEDKHNNLKPRWSS